MQEIRFHGRGGQGSVIGSEILAQAFFIEGKFVQAFPAFGVERRGAPVAAFCRMDSQPINLRNQIYRPDHVVILEDSLLDTIPVMEGLKIGGTLLINSPRSPEVFRGRFDKQYQAFWIDAGSIALACRLGSISNPIVNTAILGAFSKATGLVDIEAVVQAIEAYLPAKKTNNQRAARDAYKLVVRV